MIMRKLATVRRINDIRPIVNADSIECAVIDGWTVVVRKGEFKIEDIVIFLEIDSWVPTKLAPFLTSPGHNPKVYDGIEGERLRTVKLRGQLSQGLVLPVDILMSNGKSFWYEGEDVSDFLGIKKWERQFNKTYSSVAKAGFPTEVPKTDQERIQNIVNDIKFWYNNNYFEWEVTEKLDGTSTTFYLDLYNEYHVCGRNIENYNTLDNNYGKVSLDLNIEERMKTNNLQGFAIQGEIVGPGIQGNKYKLDKLKFFVYDVYNVKEGRYLSSIERLCFVDNIGLDHVPVLMSNYIIDQDINELIISADGRSLLHSDTWREGLVFKKLDGTTSFKIISNKYLIKFES